MNCFACKSGGSLNIQLNIANPNETDCTALNCVKMLLVSVCFQIYTKIWNEG